MDFHQTVKLHRKREIKDNICTHFQRTLHVTHDLVRRIGLEVELEGHNGCVNCLQWNNGGDLLASGSDDVQIILWDPFKHKKLTSIKTGHHGNIFSVKFLPHSNDGIIVSGAADNKIRVHEIRSCETTHVFSCHLGRVKRLAIAPNVPFMFWSAAEDGTVMEFDLRMKHQCSSNCNSVLINLNAHIGPSAEAKCLAINPLSPHQLAVGANDPFVRLYDRRMLTTKTLKYPNENHPRGPWEVNNLKTVHTMDGEDFRLPPGSVQYFVAGHLPVKQQDFRKRYRTLASTYVTFSPDGKELLVNLGGEQIYLFDINHKRHPQCFDFGHLALGVNGLIKETCALSNGYNTHRNGTTANGVTVPMPSTSTANYVIPKEMQTRKRSQNKALPPSAEALKCKANAVYDKQQYTLAISLYNQAIQTAPDSSVLFSNRAATYMKRTWDGDFYAALRDCLTALELDSNNLKAHFRLARCLYELQWTKEALDCLQIFKIKFPDEAHSNACEALDRDIKAAIFSKTEQDPDIENSSPNQDRSPNHQAKVMKTVLSDQEKELRASSCDYELRYCGHCNTTTDIKEANYFGSNGQFIVAGSDDGSFFMWDKKTTNIVRVLRGDDSIVNCLQPHPSGCLLATSGIDPVVRLWSPRPEDGSKNGREVSDSDDAATANQKRMNADPLEVMLLNMGYRITGVLEGDEDGDRDVVPCRPS